MKAWNGLFVTVYKHLPAKMQSKKFISTQDIILIQNSVTPFATFIFLKHRPSMQAKTALTTEPLSQHPLFLTRNLSNGTCAAWIFQGTRSMFMAPGTAPSGRKVHDSVLFIFYRRCGFESGAEPRRFLNRFVTRRTFNVYIIGFWVLIRLFFFYWNIKELFKYFLRSTSEFQDHLLGWLSNVVFIYSWNQKKHPMYNIRMYWTNFCLPTIRLHQYIFEKTLI